MVQRFILLASNRTQYEKSKTRQRRLGSCSRSTLFLLQAAALAAASGSFFFEGDSEGVQDDDDGIETLYLVLNLLLYGTMLTRQLLPVKRDPSLFDQRLMWTKYTVNTY